MSDLLILIVFLTAFGSCTYFLGHERGRQQGWADAQGYRDPTDQAGA